LSISYFLIKIEGTENKRVTKQLNFELSDRPWEINLQELINTYPFLVGW
jgi:hypothetical protein